MSDRFMVAEVSKNWNRGGHFETDLLLAQMFEKIINHWDERGYKLHSFTLHRLVTSEDNLNETIIAVFERSSP